MILGLGDDGRIQVTAGSSPNVGISYLSPADARAVADRLRQLADEADAATHAPGPDTERPTDPEPTASAAQAKRLRTTRTP